MLASDFTCILLQLNAVILIRYLVLLSFVKLICWYEINTTKAVTFAYVLLFDFTSLTVSAQLNFESKSYYFMFTVNVLCEQLRQEYY